MKINIYDQNLNRVAIIGTVYVSCFWSEGYNTTESFTLELRDREDYRKNIKEDYYVGREDRKTLMVIKNIQITSGKMIVSGKQATRVLDDVSFIGTIKANSEVDKEVKKVYDLTDGYANVSFDETSLGVKYGGQLSHKSFLNLCTTMASETDLGFRAIRKNGVVLMQFYNPEERADLVFKKEYGNLLVNDVSFSKESFKNFAYVLGEGEGEDRRIVTIDKTNGEEKREMIVDASDIRSETGETLEEYDARLFERGSEKLLEASAIQKVSVTVSANDFGKKYDLGDIATVLIPEYGIKIKSRIARFQQTAQANKVDTVVEIGEIKLRR